ncbi:MAG: hypothetical protein ABFC77_11360 [Thermoguttaceae bacterium]
MLAIIVATFAGCGGKRGRELAPVSGKVTYQGKPLQFGTVLFQPDRGQYAVGKIRQDGSFQMMTPGEGDGAPIGKHCVRITCREKQNSDRTVGERPLGELLIPEKYNSCATSGITVEVRPGANDPVILDLK